MTTRPRVIVTRRLPDAVEAALRQQFDVEASATDAPTTAEELQRFLGQCDGLLATVTDRLTAEVLAAYPIRTKIIANFGVGVEHIDLAAARAHDIIVTNTPDVLTDCTADLAMMLILMCMRRAGEGERIIRGNRWAGWRPTEMMGRRVSGTTLGIVGMGRIGRALARRAHHGFGMRVLCATRTPLSPAELAEFGGEPRATVEGLLADADVVSLHCPSTPETRDMINAQRLARMKRGAFLVNTARGDIVVDADVIAALKSGQLAGAGLDVFRGEPNINPGYLELENAVLLPHLGSATLETREAMGFRALANLSAYFDGNAVRDRVG